MQELDPRIVKIGVEVNGRIKYYEGLALTATGTKYANANQNECEVKLTNLDKETANYILTETSPFTSNRTPKFFIVEAGRQSYGTSRIFSGNVTNSSISQPPDTAITIKCLTANNKKGNIVSRNQPKTANLKQISSQVANDLGLTLNFQAKDKAVSNYSYTGAALKQVNALGDAGEVSAYVDDGALVVKEMNLPLNNTLRILNIDTGMIGIPEITEHGIKVKFLIDNQTTLGGALQIVSAVYPAVNGTYVIYKLGFEIASRDTPFYWIAEAKRR